MPTTKTNSSPLNANALREISPSLCRLTATIEATKAIGAVEKIKLGPSQVSG